VENVLKFKYLGTTQTQKWGTLVSGNDCQWDRLCTFHGCVPAIIRSCCLLLVPSKLWQHVS